MVYGGDESIEQLAGPKIPSDLINLDASRGPAVDMAILNAVPSNEDSVIIAAPETAEAVRAWRVINALTEAIGSMETLEQLFKRVMDIIFHEVPVDRGFILMYDGSGTELVPSVVRYRKVPKGKQPERIRASKTIIQHVLRKREGVLCTNAMTDARFSGKDREGSIHKYGLRSVICVPLIAREDLLGAIHLDCGSSSHTYSEDQLRLITAIGYVAGLAAENIQLVQSRVQNERLAATGETVAYLSHNIKNILQGLRSGADVLESGIRAKEWNAASQGWQILSRGLDRILNMSMNMLAYSKEREPRREHVQLNQVVAEAATLAQPHADLRGVMLLADTDEPLPPIPIDQDGIGQATLNIIHNAIDAAPAQNGRVIVKTAFDPATGEASIRVTDNGPGIPPEMKAEIFEPFKSSKGHAGTGLGLPVAKKIVREHNGTIDVNNEPEGGTTFTVRLPTRPDRDLGSAETFAPARKPLP
jgi:signal transduction histidine kinase